LIVGPKLIISKPCLDKLKSSYRSKNVFLLNALKELEPFEEVGIEHRIMQKELH
jgi:hypothetical protein